MLIQFWILCELLKVLCIVRALLHFSPRFKLRMEETVCGSYDSKSVPVAKRIYPFPSTGTIVTETRVPLKSCLLFLFFVHSSPLRPPFLFSRGAPSSADARYPFLIQCAFVLLVANKILPRLVMAQACSPGCRGKYNEKIRFRFSRTISRPRCNGGRDCFRCRFRTIPFKVSPREMDPSMRRYANRKSKEIYQLLQVSVHRHRQHNHMSADDLH